ncbi:hypothetical protein [Muricoccus nepalensis]|uniref:hypothetical protein n=1 Tax=Muricoccus nepalensis TaxID=1854500 RepID=UPI0013875614|nr:hypothetical protein [Roseomonas nepalensis]
MPLALLGTLATRRLTGGEHGPDHLLVGTGSPGSNRTRRRANIGAVEVESDALRELLNHLLAETGIGAGGTGLRTRVALLDALDQDVVGASLNVWMRADHLLDMHGCDLSLCAWIERGRMWERTVRPFAEHLDDEAVLLIEMLNSLDGI